MSLDQGKNRNGGSGDIRDRLGKRKGLDDSLEACEDDEDDDDKGFMSDRRVVERDRENESNGSDLRMTLKNDLAERIGRKEDKEERQVIVKNEAEVEERRKKKEEEKQKEEERRIRHEEEIRREEKKRGDASQNGAEKSPATKRKTKARDTSSDSDEKSKRFGHFIFWVASLTIIMQRLWQKKENN